MGENGRSRKLLRSPMANSFSLAGLLVACALLSCASAEPWLLVHKAAPSAADHAVAGSTFEVQIAIHNKGDEPAYDVTSTDSVSWPADKFQVVKGSLSESFAQIGAGGSAKHSVTLKALSGSSVTLPVMTSTVEYYAEAGAKEETGSSITGKSNPVADLQILTFGEHISTVSKSFFMKYTNNGKLFAPLLFCLVAWQIFSPVIKAEAKK